MPYQLRFNGDNTDSMSDGTWDLLDPDGNEVSGWQGQPMPANGNDWELWDAIWDHAQKNSYLGDMMATLRGTFGRIDNRNDVTE